MFSRDDFHYMRRAISLAEKGQYTTDPNPRVGCVIVKDGVVLGEGYHKYAGGKHAEIEAISDANQRAKERANINRNNICGATVYVTLEPCSHYGRTPPCAATLIDERVGKVIVAMKDPNPKVSGNGIKMLEDNGVEVVCGLMEKEAADLNKGFIKRMQTGLPYVFCKMAMSLDGKTAMESGESKWITGSDARRDVHRLRASSSAIITGIGTVLNDDPRLTARLDDEDLLQPQKVILDPNFDMPLDAACLKEAEIGIPTETMIITATNNKDKEDSLKKMGVSIEKMDAVDGCFNLHQILMFLASKDINAIMVESGSVLAGGFLDKGLLDEIIIYMAPLIMGENTKGLFVLPELDKMRDRIEVEIKEILAIGCDFRISVIPKYKLS